MAVARAVQWTIDSSAANATASSPTNLKIVHVLRAPLGGLFRHVIDLVQGQAARGHHVGLILDSMTGGARAEAMLRSSRHAWRLVTSGSPYRASSACAISLPCVASCGASASSHPMSFTGMARKARHSYGWRPTHRQGPGLHAPWRLAGLQPGHREWRILSHRWSVY